MPTLPPDPPQPQCGSSSRGGLTASGGRPILRLSPWRASAAEVRTASGGSARIPQAPVAAVAGGEGGGRPLAAGAPVIRLTPWPASAAEAPDRYRAGAPRIRLIPGAACRLRRPDRYGGERPIPPTLIPGGWRHAAEADAIAAERPYPASAPVAASASAALPALALASDWRRAPVARSRWASRGIRCWHGGLVSSGAAAPPCC